MLKREVRRQASLHSCIHYVLSYCAHLRKFGSRTSREGEREMNFTSHYWLCIQNRVRAYRVNWLYFLLSVFGITKRYILLEKLYSPRVASFPWSKFSKFSDSTVLSTTNSPIAHPRTLKRDRVRQDACMQKCPRRWTIRDCRHMSATWWLAWVHEGGRDKPNGNLRFRVS